MNDEHGYTLVELLVGMMVSLIVLGAILTIVQVATRHQDRTAEHVAANQRARPAMTRIIDRLHAACVSPGLAPVRAGSTENSMILLSMAGDDVSPTPDEFRIALANGVLSETVYKALPGGSPPNWTFSSAASSTFALVDGVSTAELGNPAAPTPLFRYYAYEDANKDGEVETVPLSPPLDSEEAARTVQIDVAFAVGSGGGGPTDDDSRIALTDSTTLRIEPASEDSAEVNRPCV